MKCDYCENTGKALQANGPDDVEEVYCDCQAGEDLRDSNIAREHDAYLEVLRENATT